MAIEIKNVTKYYGNKKVVDDVSVTIPEGKITSFIGPNGAGKSTIISIIGRLLTADKGEIYLRNKLLSAQKNEEIAKQLSILKQSNHINLRLTVEELVAFGRFPYSKGHLTQNDHAIINEAIAYMDLTLLKKQYISQLSGGQQQRAYIAMTLAQNTDYILLDEPLNNLDMKHSVQIMNVLRNLATELNKTIVIVIHDINFASCYSDYIVAMKAGKLLYQGKVKEMMSSSILEDIYEMKIPIEQINHQQIALYFRN
ncbi:iron ABC transporter ATP-binding protein [[Pasteurella] aerogenes]|nr:ATP-binding cassette domain-containing protein [[Pasteurella] aerogenes]MDY2796750.1 ATP-binding cassette domain-containing protein [[Pasteurella] aerogenes]UWZ92846.1 ATP-binding cassette domain-containing protein [[Pasteurella] aerogenes]